MSDLDRLIRFAAVAQELSFSRAAKQLRVDQPWLSRQIQQLEAQLGFPLFVRSTRKVSLTSEGEALLAHAAELARVAEQTREALRNLGRDHGLVIALGVNPFTFWLPARAEMLARFAARYRRARVEIVSNYTPRLVSKLRKRSLDLALAPRPLKADDLEQLVVHRAPPSLLIPQEDRLARVGKVAIAELRGKRIAVINPKLNPANFAAVYGPFLEAGAEPVIIPEGQPAIGHHAAVERLIMVSLGWPNSELGAPPGFVHAPLAEPAHNVEYALIRRREPARLLLDQFWQVAREVAAELVKDETRPQVQSVSRGHMDEGAFAL
jgi:DNA-binding transcriptional LysR family regulator